MTHIFFILEWIERRQLFINIFTGQALEIPSRRNSIIGTRTNVQNVQNKYGTLTAKLLDKIPFNKLCVDRIDPYKIHEWES